MSVTLSNTSRQSGPTWDIARIFPDQGNWTDGAYLDATRHARQLVELNDGYIDVLPMPTFEHQRIVGFLYRAVFACLLSLPQAEVILAPAKVRLRGGRFREPDLMVRLGRSPEDTSDYAVRVDIAVEVVSPNWADHDRVVKRAEYAESGIPEYWIIDPTDASVLVLTLDQQTREYKVHGRYSGADRVRSAILPTFDVSAQEVFAAARP